MWNHKLGHCHYHYFCVSLTNHIILLNLVLTPKKWVWANHRAFIKCLFVPLKIAGFVSTYFVTLVWLAYFSKMCLQWCPKCFINCKGRSHAILLLLYPSSCLAKVLQGERSSGGPAQGWYSPAWIYFTSVAVSIQLQCESLDQHPGSGWKDASQLPSFTPEKSQSKHFRNY